MHSVVLVLGALLVLCTAQCTVDGNTYGFGLQSITFGAAVGDKFPAILYYGISETTRFGYWTSVDDGRWEIMDVASVSGTMCEGAGQYTPQFSNNCGTLQLTRISDDCLERANLLTRDWTLVVRGATASCISTGTVLHTTFEGSSTLPALSEEDATIVFGYFGYATVSVNTRGMLFQRWAETVAHSGETTSILDLGSFGEGLHCGTGLVGHYVTDWDINCGVQLCGISDTCVSRGELLHGAKINGYQTLEECPSSDPGFGRCNPGGDEWEAHPYECIDQDVEGGCMFCLGRANDRESRQCLDRNGAVCQDIFESPAGRAFCTLEFECPASTSAFSLGLFICSLVALLVR